MAKQILHNTVDDIKIHILERACPPPDVCRGLEMGALSSVVYG